MTNMKWLLWIALLSLPIAAQAQTSNTTPSGFFTLNIAQGTGTTSVLSLLSVPLLNDANVTGPVRGVISAVTANTITNSADGSQNNPYWTAGQLSNVSTPMLIRITSGNAIGRTFLISSSTANTTTTLTIDSTDPAQAPDLTTLGIATGSSGDSYEILAGYTLSTLFPASAGIQGGTSSSNVDIVELFVTGAWHQYYYNTSSGHWLQVGPPINSDNVVVRPDAGILYSRIGATPISVVLLGSVSTTQAVSVVANSGVTFLGNTWPTDLTLGTSNINLISNWVSGTSSTNADIVQLFVSGAWHKYYFNTSTTPGHWLQVGPPINSDSQAISAGSSVILSKTGVASGNTLLTQPLPYSL